MSSVFDSRLVAEIRQRIVEKIKHCDEMILNGNVETMEGYKRIVGMRTGFLDAIVCMEEAEVALTSPSERKKA